MRFLSLVIPVALLASIVVPVNARAVHSTQNFTLSEKLQIPGAVLQPGDYTFSVEDRLQDRAIVRITSADGKKHFLALTVPDAKLPHANADGLIFFSSVDSRKQVLRGWKCPDCRAGLEFVYPKAEAAKITDASAESILAVDPPYDKLPANLSPDDMKVVTLWLLSPQRITAKNKGEGVSAEKYAEVRPASEPVEQVALAQPHRRLPKTASNTFSLAWWGLLLMAGGIGAGALRRRRAEG